MLILLTNKCFMNCTHCFNESSAEGLDMSLDILQDLIKFIKEVKPRFLTISGGEFTENPYFDFIIKEIIKNTEEFNTKLILLSNGMFILNKEKTNQIKELLKNSNVLFLQITTGENFYPKFDIIENHKQELKDISPKITYCYFPHYLEDKSLLPMGRALVNHRKETEIYKRNPSCINLFLLAKQKMVNNFAQIIEILQTQSFNNLCKPLIDPMGFVRGGESINCQIIGNINDDLNDIFKRLIHGNPCDKCGLLKNTPIMIKKILGLS